jgi:O-antigen/teichoic acid export membrane protein
MRKRHACLFNLMKSPASEMPPVGLMNASPYSRENVRKGIVHYLFGRGMSAAAGFFTIILLVRHMDVPGYAAYTAILGLTMIAGMLAGLGMERALTRYIPEGVMHHSGQALARFIWITSAVRFLVMVALIATLYLVWPIVVANFTGLNVTSGFPLALAFLMMNTAMFQLFSAVMQALVQQKTLTRVLVVQWGGRLALILLLVANYNQITLNQALWLMALPDGIGMLILIGVIQKYLGSLDRLNGPGQISGAPWPSWPRVRRLALDNYGYNLLAALPQSSSMIILAAAFLAAPFVAAYGFYISLLDRLKQYLPLQFMLNIAEPVLIAGYIKEQDFDRLCHHSRLLYKFNLLLILPGLAWIAAIASPLTALLTGGKFAEYAWIFPVLILQIALGSHATIVQIIINAVGKSEILMRSGCFALAAMVAVTGIILASGQYEYLVAAPLAYELANNLVAIIGLGGRGFRYDPQMSFHWKLVAATGLAYIGAVWAADYVASPLWQVLIAGIVSLVAFGASAALMRAMDRRDFATLKGMLQKKRKHNVES